MNSDKDNVHPLLTQIIPAGHCTCASATEFKCDSCLSGLDRNTEKGESSSGSSEDSDGEGINDGWTFAYGRDDKNEGLTRDECNAAFPGLFEDIHRASGYWQNQKKKNKVSLKDELDRVELKNGMARARIYDGELYVLETRAAQEDHRRKIVASLSAMYRALSHDQPTWKDKSKNMNVEFIFSIEDRLDDVSGRGHPIWVLARKANEEAVWLMPDFGFWSWDNPSSGIGPYSQIVERIEQREQQEQQEQQGRENKTPSWSSSKIQKLVWRGKLSFAPKLRRRLLEVSRGRAWGDVKELVWTRKDHFISMEDHCKYAFIAHVEGMLPRRTRRRRSKTNVITGRSFSSSLKYRQACRSVVVAHRLQYIQHHHYLLRSSGEHQNFVEVERDFSDLPQKIEGLIAQPSEAERIAENNVRMFRERYLTKAAEACYWRALWKGYANAMGGEEDKEKEKEGEGKGRIDNVVERGLRYESFVLLESKEMMRFSYGERQRKYGM